MSYSTQNIGQFGDVLPSQTIGLVLRKQDAQNSYMTKHDHLTGHFLGLYLKVQDKDQHHAIPQRELFVVLLMTLSYVNSAANPILYAVFSHNFRHLFRRLLCANCLPPQPDVPDLGLEVLDLGLDIPDLVHRHNHPMGSLGRVPFNFGEPGDTLYLVPSNFCSCHLVVGLYTPTFHQQSGSVCGAHKDDCGLKGREMDADREWVQQ